MPQRFAAAIAAIGRDDEKELNQLKSSSPDGEYVINKLSARINDFNFMSVVIRLTLHEQLGKWLLAQTIDGLIDPESRSVCDQVIKQSLEETASAIVARDSWLEKIGIPLGDFEAYDAPQDGLIEELIKLSRGKENSDKVELYETCFTDFFQNRHPITPLS
ncbi:hypothetical protein N8580_03700 [Akkermansiaceae bacterium]|nr:hypothetical protein [Akkermansiaceae bacterium]